MHIWAIADLHLALSVPEKKMDIFGPGWTNYMARIKENWSHKVKDDDLVLIPGDITWAMKIQDAKIDLKWIHELPGTKVLLRGNHDYWWTSVKQINAILPPSIHIIQNNAIRWNEWVIGGARLWDTQEYNFDDFINFTAKKDTMLKDKNALDEAEKIFIRELGRLRNSLVEMDKMNGKKIVMTHYPPISASLDDSRASQLLEQFEVDTCVFGHLHNVKKELPLFGEKKGVNYILTSSDYLNFEPILIK